MVLIVGRTYSSGTAADYEAVHAIQDQYTLIPLAMSGNPDPRRDEGAVDPAVDMTTPPRDQIDQLGAGEFFALFSRLLKTNPPTRQDAPVLEVLNRLGLVGEFDMARLPDVVARETSRVPEAAHKAILGHYARQKQANGWVISTGSGHYGIDYLQRALVAYIGVGGNLPEDAFYPIGRFDGDGKTLTGANKYVMRFSPVDARHRLTRAASGPSPCTTASTSWSTIPSAAIRSRKTGSKRTRTAQRTSTSRPSRPALTNRPTGCRLPMVTSS